MNQHALLVLEYDKVIKVVAGFAASAAGKERVLALVPSTESGIVETRLRETGEYTYLLRSAEAPPLDEIKDIRNSLNRLRVAGSMLAPSELFDVGTTLHTGRKLKKFFLGIDKKSIDEAHRTPLLCLLAENLGLFTHIEDAVFSAIDEKAEVRDSASPALRKLRKQIVRMREDILGRLSHILQDVNTHKVVQDPVVTVRDDRYVLPLKPNFRQSLNGVVHGQSGSRSTLFVEPLEILEQNNRLAELRMEESEEVERILRELTSLMTQEAEAIGNTVETLAKIDAVHARARFGMAFGGTVPVLTTGRTMRLRALRHPLLVVMHTENSKVGGEITPNTIELNSGDLAVILSGPNAGGKTVILKAIGLFALMAQAGIPVTAAEGCELPCFHSVFADIGDEQSLEQDLSTFSSHVHQIAEILRDADSGSLVLLDELGSGTDPNEGAALGTAVLESLIGRGCVTLATTHHNALKLFAAQTVGAVNASMEFDPRSLKPSYRLMPGRPGRSYGLDMAVRLGVPDDVVARARSRISDDDTRLDTLLKQVEHDSQLLSLEREQLGRELAALKRDKAEADALLSEARETRNSIRTKTREEARDILSALRRRLRELAMMPSLSRPESMRLASEIEALAKQMEPAESEHPAWSGPLPVVRCGERVRLVNMNRTGTVLGVQGTTVEIDVDGKKVKLPAHQIAPTGASLHARDTLASPVSGWSTDLKEEGSADRLNILGYHVDEALVEVDRFIDHAGLRGITIVTIVHGLGTGALKQAVTGHLKGHPLVSAMRPGMPAEGGAGVTLVELKQ